MYVQMCVCVCALGIYVNYLPSRLTRLTLQRG